MPLMVSAQISRFQISANMRTNFSQVIGFGKNRRSGSNLEEVNVTAALQHLRAIRIHCQEGQTTPEGLALWQSGRPTQDRSCILIWCNVQDKDGNRRMLACDCSWNFVLFKTQAMFKVQGWYIPKLVFSSKNVHGRPREPVGPQSCHIPLHNWKGSQHQTQCWKHTSAKQKVVACTPFPTKGDKRNQVVQLVQTSPFHQVAKISPFQHTSTTQHISCLLA